MWGTNMSLLELLLIGGDDGVEILNIPKPLDLVVEDGPIIIKYGFEGETE